MSKGNGKCSYCEKVIRKGPIACEGCKELFTLLLRVRKLKRKTERIGYKRILLKVKYLEVLEAMRWNG